MVGRPAAEGIAVACCAALLVLLQATHWGWTIEDAAICYAYARNLAEGHGLVPSPGGERVEAYSDPAWIAVLAGFQALGWTGFTVAKPLGMGLGAATVVVVWRTARLALPEGRGALVAPFAFAVNAQVAVWHASGLENALFGLLLAGAIHRVALELEAPRAPWSAVLYVLLAWTRPEGVAYAALGFAALALARRPVTAFGAVFAVPLLLSEAVRLWYFAWPLPNPFYAKVAQTALAPLDWDSRGWSQLRDWAGRMWHGWLAPVYVVGLCGADGWRARAGAVTVGAVAAGLLVPPGFGAARVVALLAAGAALPLLAVGRPGGGVRALCGASVFVGLLFHVVADGDWMGAWRFVSLVSAPLAVLFATGVAESAALAGEPIVATVGAALLLPPNLVHLRDHRWHDRAETPELIRRRVDHLRHLVRTTFHDGPVSNLDIDQGAFLWWAPDFHQLDLGRLVEVPFARHGFQQRAFVREYVFEQERPTFANVGGFWVAHTGLRRYPEWAAAYVETPGYAMPDGGWFHGVFVRRELFVAPSWDGTPGRRVELAGDLALAGVEVPAPWTPGRAGYLEAPLVLGRPRTEGIALRAFLARDGELVAAFPLEVGYGLYPVAGWRPGEVFRGRYAVAVPEDLAPGRYDLGFVFGGADGSPIPALVPADDPVLARGEVRFPGLVEVVDPDTLAARAAEARSVAIGDAASARCEAAEAGWIRLARHRPTDWSWQDAQRPGVARAIADCWARRGGVDALARAHEWDFDSPELARVGGPVAEQLLAEGAAARAAGDWQTAWARFDAVLSFQPWRAWARRWAEEARDHRLGLLDPVWIGHGGEDELRASEEGR